MKILFMFVFILYQYESSGWDTIKEWIFGNDYVIPPDRLAKNILEIQEQQKEKSEIEMTLNNQYLQIFKQINYEYYSYIIKLIVESIHDDFNQTMKKLEQKNLKKYEIVEKDKYDKELIFVGDNNFFNLKLESVQLNQQDEENKLKSYKDFFDKTNQIQPDQTDFTDKMQRYTLYVKKYKEDISPFYKVNISFVEKFQRTLSEKAYDAVIHIALENQVYKKKIQVSSAGKRNFRLQKFLSQNMRDFFAIQRQIIYDFEHFQDDLDRMLHIEFSGNQFKVIDEVNKVPHVFSIQDYEDLNNNNIYIEKQELNFDQIPSEEKFKTKIQLDQEANDQKVSFYIVKLLDENQLKGDFSSYVKKQFQLFDLDLDLEIDFKLKNGINILCYRLYPLQSEFNYPVEIFFLIKNDILYYIIQSEYVTIKKKTEQITFRAVLKIFERNIFNFKKQYLFQKRLESRKLIKENQKQEDLTPYYKDFTEFLTFFNRNQFIYNIYYNSETNLKEQNKKKKDYEFTYQFQPTAYRNIDQMLIKDEQDSENKDKDEKKKVKKKILKSNNLHKDYDHDSIFHQTSPTKSNILLEDTNKDNKQTVYDFQIKKLYPFFSQFEPKTFLLATEVKFSKILSQINTKKFLLKEIEQSKLFKQLEDVGNPFINQGLRKDKLVFSQLEDADYDMEMVVYLKNIRVRNKLVRKMYFDYVWKINN